MLIFSFFIFRYSSGKLHLCGCKGHQFKFPFHLLMNACAVRRALHITGQDAEALIERLYRVSADANSIQ